MKLSPDLRSRLIDSGANVVEVDSFEEMVDGKPIIESLDCLYMTRIQTEHNSEQDRREFADLQLDQYRLSTELVSRMKEYSAILHPFPRDHRFQEIPPEIDTDSRAMYFRQARNGMWIRAALVAYLFDVDGRIASHHSKHFAEFHDYNTGVL